MTRVLLIEDDARAAEAMLGAFDLRGIKSVHAATVAQAKAAYLPDSFDVLVVDYELPDGTGLDFLAFIRGSDKAVTVMYSGLDRTRELDAAGMHVDHQISKSDPFALLHVIEAVKS